MNFKASLAKCQPFSPGPNVLRWPTFLGHLNPYSMCGTAWKENTICGIYLRPHRDAGRTKQGALCAQTKGVYSTPCWLGILLGQYRVIYILVFISKYVYWYRVLYICISIFVSALIDPISWLIKLTRLVMSSINKVSVIISGDYSLRVRGITYTYIYYCY